MIERYQKFTLERKMIMIRKIVHIDEEKCDGCGLCIPSCAEGAIQIIDGKARLVGDKYCDGLGACLGNCPQDAIHIIEREADEFDEESVKAHLENINKGKTPVSGQQSTPQHSHGGCPGSRMRTIQSNTSSKPATASSSEDVTVHIRPQLQQWPVQLHLVPVQAPYFENADLLVAADCVPFAYADFHLDLLKGKKVLVGCPKLDDLDAYIEKLTEIFRRNTLRSITVAFMEVPCCSGMVYAVKEALSASGKSIPLNLVKISLEGERM